VTDSRRHSQQKIFRFIVKAGDVASLSATSATIGTVVMMLIPGAAVGLGTIVGAMAGIAFSVSKLSKSQNDGGLLEYNSATAYKAESEIKERMRLEDMSALENDINDLSDVIIVCHQIEEPEGKLLNAVKKNLSRGVRYTFLVSKDCYQLEVNRYFQFFVTTASILSETLATPIRVRELVRIRPLRMNWNDSPYIFYRAKKEDDSLATIVFKGDEMNQGICEVYNLIDPSIAPTIYNLLMESVDWQEEIQDQRFTVPNRSFIRPEEFEEEFLEN
jgi:hypothetical protein